MLALRAVLPALALAVLLAAALVGTSGSPAALAASAATAATAPAPTALAVAARLPALARLALRAALRAALGLLSGRLVSAPSARRVRTRRAALSRRLFIHHLYYPLEIFAPVHISSAPGNSPGHRPSSAFSAWPKNTAVAGSTSSARLPGRVASANTWPQGRP